MKPERAGRRYFKGTLRSSAIKIYGGCNYIALQTADRKSRPRATSLGD